MIEKYGKKSVEVLDTYFLCDEFDLHTFPENHPCYCSDQEGWFGKFKFEFDKVAGDRITGTYSITDKGYIDDYAKYGEHKVLAGVKKEEKKKKISSEKVQRMLTSKEFLKRISGRTSNHISIFENIQSLQGKGNNHKTKLQIL